MPQKSTHFGTIKKSHLEVFGFTEDNSAVKWVSEKDKEITDASIWLELEKAEFLGAQGIYFRYFPQEQKQQPKAQIYIYSFGDEKEISNLRKKLWNASPVPLVFVFLPNRVEIFDTYSDKFWTSDDRKTTLIEDILFTLSDVEKAKVAKFNAALFDSGLFWDSPKGKQISTATSSYHSLLQDLKGWKKKALEDVTDDKQIRVVKRILLSIILIRYLEDRRDAEGNTALNKKKVYGQWVTNIELPELQHIFEGGVDLVLELFRFLSGDDKFNGAIFILEVEEIQAFRLLNLDPFIKFLKSEEDPNTTQLRLPFWETYDFGYLPIELISHIYEDFLAAEGEDGNRDTGVVYTPPSLVQFLIDQTMPIHQPNLHLKVLDPACGSGIFLVGAFKRMIQWWRKENGYVQPGKADIPVLKQMLVENIFGADINQEAILISYFSLSLALLDAFSPKDVWGNIQFPNLRTTNLFGNFFDSPTLPTDFDLIIGNPPFKSKLKEAEKRADEKLKQQAKLQKQTRPKLPDNQLALLFFEQSFLHLKPEGKTCFVLPSGPVLYNINVSAYRQYLMEQVTFDTIFDFTALRTSLFKRSKGEDNKQPSVVTLIAKNSKPTDELVVSHLILRKTQSSKERMTFEVDYYDTFQIRYEEAKADPRIWQVNFMGGGRLRFLLEKLANYPSIEDFINKNKIKGWVIGEGWMESPNDKRIKRLRELDTKPALSNIESKELSKLRDAHLGLWIENKPFVETFDFKSSRLEHVKLCKKRYFLWPRVKTKKIFEPPHLMVYENISLRHEGLVVEFTADQYVTFKSQIFGIHAPIEDSEKLNLLSKFLSLKQTLQLCYLYSGRVISVREGVPLMGDILSLPFPDHELTFSKLEQVLLDDLKQFQIPFRFQGEKSKALQPVEKSPDLLNQFSHWFTKILNTSFDGIKAHKPLMGEEFIAMAYSFGEPEIAMPEKLEELDEWVKKTATKQISFNFKVNRIVQLYIRNMIILIKPNQQRYWTRSIAMRDADHVFAYLLAKGN